MEEIKTPFKDTPTMARIRKGLFGIDWLTKTSHKNSVWLDIFY
jgi:hypothetical protein